MAVGRGGFRLLLLRLLLLLAEKVDDELLVVLDEVVLQALLPQVVAEVLAPPRIEGIQQREIAHPAQVARAAGRHAVVVVAVVVVLAGGVRRRRRGRVPVAAEYAAEPQEAVLVGRGLTVSAEGRLPRGPARVLLPVVHLLEEQRGLLLIDKGQAGDTVF